MPTATARTMWQDLYAAGFGTSLTTAEAVKSGAYAGRAAFPLLNHPHLSSGQTTIENRKAVGMPTRLAGTGFEYQQGHKIPTTSWEFDVTAHNIVQVLKTLVGSTGYSTATEGGATYLTFRKYTNPNPDRYMTLVRKVSASGSDSHRMSGAIATSVQLTGAENQAFKTTVNFQGRDVSYDYAWGTTDNENFDTSLDPLLWKNANVAIGTIFEGYPGLTCAITSGGSENPCTVALAAGIVPNMTTLVEPGSYIVFKDNNIKYGPIKTVTASTPYLTLGSETNGLPSVGATSNFKIINFFKLPAIDITLTNNAVSKAYDEAQVERHILGDLTGSGNVNIPFSEIPAADGGTTPGFSGGKWLELFLNGGVVRFWIWWGHPYDAVLDSRDDGDFGMAFNIRATGDGIEDESGEQAVTIPFDIVGTNYATGSIINGQAAAGTGLFHLTGSGTDWVAKGSEILSSSPAIGTHREDIVTYLGTTQEIRYVANTTYSYTWGALASSGTSYGYYNIHGPAIKIRLGVGLWNTEVQ